MRVGVGGGGFGLNDESSPGTNSREVYDEVGDGGFGLNDEVGGGVFGLNDRSSPGTDHKGL